MGTKCPSAVSPGDPLVTFPSLGKSLAPQGEIPQTAQNCFDGPMRTSAPTKYGRLDRDGGRPKAAPIEE